jgi:hypothetical protein
MPNNKSVTSFKGDWDVTSGKLVSGRVSISRSGGDMGCRLVHPHSVLPFLVFFVELHEEWLLVEVGLVESRDMTATV